jgi:CRISPR system Cascade subunit CasB
MSNLHTRFALYLQALTKDNRGALAALRRSMAFAPGTHAPAMPFVEPFVAQDGTHEAQRTALYVAAGLFAANPRHLSGQSFAGALAEARLRRKSESIEQRFIALLGADAEGLPVHLRHAGSLLATEELGFDVARLAADLRWWLDPWRDTERDRVRQQWARDFYGALAKVGQPASKTPSTDDDTQKLKEATP